MAVTNAPIRYQDLIDGFAARILQLGKNIDAYDSSVPNELRYPYTNTVPITVENGKTPKVVYTNTSKIAVVSTAIVTTQFNDFCNAQLLTNNANANTFIHTATVLKFISAIFCFIQSKFATVYSPLTSTTSVFYIPSYSILTAYIYNNPNFSITEQNITNLINDICSSAIANTKSITVVDNYTFLRQ